VFDRLASLLSEGLGTSDSNEAFGIPDFVDRLADGFQQGLGRSADEARGLAQQVADGIQVAIDEKEHTPTNSDGYVSGGTGSGLLAGGKKDPTRPYIDMGVGSGGAGAAPPSYGASGRPAPVSGGGASLATNPITRAALPVDGKIRYVPPKSWTPSQPLPRGPKNGYVDKFGNEWVPGRGVGKDIKEWDVQLGRNATDGMRAMSKDGKHVNVSIEGKVTH
jgi:filamentous hemagglutinin